MLTIHPVNVRMCKTNLSHSGKLEMSAQGVSNFKGTMCKICECDLLSMQVQSLIQAKIKYIFR